MNYKERLWVKEDGILNYLSLSQIYHRTIAKRHGEDVFGEYNLEDYSLLSDKENNRPNWKRNIKIKSNYREQLYCVYFNDNNYLICDNEMTLVKPNHKKIAIFDLTNKDFILAYYVDNDNKRLYPTKKRVTNIIRLDCVQNTINFNIPFFIRDSFLLVGGYNE